MEMSPSRSQAVWVLKEWCTSDCAGREFPAVRSYAKYLRGKDTGEGCLLVPISTSELWDGIQEGEHSDRDVCCRLGGEPALIRSNITPFLSTPTS